MRIAQPTNTQKPLDTSIVGAIGLFAAIWFFFNHSVVSTTHDLGWSYGAGADLLNGRDPYRHTAHGDQVPYPLTAAIIFFPFIVFSPSIAVALFVGISSMILAYSIIRRGERWRLLIFLGPCFLMAAKSGQWSMLLMAALYRPELAWVGIAKPNMLLPILSPMRTSSRSTLIALVIVVTSLMIQPNWPAVWLDQIGAFSGFIPLLTEYGWLLGIAVLFAGRWQGRLLLSMTIVPQQVYWYDQLLLGAIPTTRLQMWLFTVISWVAFYIAWESFASLRPSVPHILLGLYLPALLCLVADRKINLQRRPRSGIVHVRDPE